MGRKAAFRAVIALAIIVAVVALILSGDVPWQVGIGLIALIGVGYGIIKRDAISSILGP